MKNKMLDRTPEVSDKQQGLIEMPFPTDTPDLGDVPLGTRAIAAATNRLYGSF